MTGVVLPIADHAPETSMKLVVNRFILLRLLLIVIAGRNVSRSQIKMANAEAHDINGWKPSTLMSGVKKLEKPHAV